MIKMDEIILINHIHEVIKFIHVGVIVASIEAVPVLAIWGTCLQYY